ncbi:hypothetical protein ACFQY5_28020 [Paeniroseomonas aquatica]|uniref:hypothetical protein n=1 Tax=Paeniroseomonas aquatica TaxID=373043 RepID=UPI003622CB19
MSAYIRPTLAESRLPAAAANQQTGAPPSRTTAPRWASRAASWKSWAVRMSSTSGSTASSARWRTSVVLGTISLLVSTARSARGTSAQAIPTTGGGMAGSGWPRW